MLFNQNRNRGEQGHGSPPAVQASTSLFLVIMLFLSYWVFVWALERIDFTVLPLFAPEEWLVVRLQLLPGPRGALEPVWPRVLRHLIPPVVGWLLAYGAAIRLVQVLYDLPDKQGAVEFLRRLRSRSGLPERRTPVNDETLEAERERSTLLRVGGPGQIIVSNGQVAVTELNGRFHRVLGPGPQTLERLEYVLMVLDLRRQERTAENVSLVTKDGIKATASVTVSFQLQHGTQVPTTSTPYPFSKKAVRTAAYAQTISPDGSVAYWDSIPLGQARGALARIINQYHLNQLLAHPKREVNPLTTVENELRRAIRKPLRDIGIELDSVSVGRLTFQQEVTDQYLAFWQADWQAQARVVAAEGEAAAAQEKELAYARAEIDMMEAILDGLQRAQQASASNMSEMVALRLIDALQRMARESSQAFPLSPYVARQLQQYQKQLSLQPPFPEEGIE